MKNHTLKCEKTVVQWQYALALADAVYSLAPWEKYCNLDVWGFTNQLTHKPAFISFHGIATPRRALVIHPDVESFYGMLTLCDRSVDPDNVVVAIDLFNINQFHIDYMEESKLKDDDFRFFEMVRYTSENRWPIFREYALGYAPADPEPQIFDTMVRALTLVKDMLPEAMARFDSNEPANRFQIKQEICFLDEDFSFKTIKPPTWKKQEAEAFLVKQTRYWEKTDYGIELLFKTLPFPIKQDDKPFFVMTLMAIDMQTKQVIGFENISPSSDALPTYEKVEACLFGILDRDKELPALIKVSDPKLHHYLASFCQAVGISLEYANTLPIADKAFLSLLDYLKNQ